MDTYEYQVAISAAGEDRAFAKDLADALRQEGLTIYYDESDKARLFGTNLVDKLHDIFYKKSEFCAMLISKAYVSKKWTKYERECALARAIEQSDEYILAIRLDDTEVPGLPVTRSHLRWPRENTATIAKIIKSKVSSKTSRHVETSVPSKRQAKADVRAFQCKLEALYDQANKDASIEHLYGYLCRTSGYLAKNAGQGKAASIDFIRPLSWLLALASRMSIDVQDAFLEKYPDNCPSCLSQPCTCFTTNKMPPGNKTLDDIQEDLVSYRDQAFRKHPTLNFDGVKNVIAMIYPNNAIIWHFSGPRFHFSKLWEEISEVHEAITGIMSGKKRISALADEIADVLAWLVGAWYLSTRPESIDRELALYYQRGCPVCGHNPCSCKANSGRAQNLFDADKLPPLNIMLGQAGDLDPRLSAGTTELVKTVSLAVELQTDPMTRLTLFRLQRGVNDLIREAQDIESGPTVIAHLRAAKKQIDALKI